MINKKLKKFISGLILTAYIVSNATVGYCVSNPSTPKLRQSITPKTVKLEGDIIISKKNPKISLSLRDADVNQVLRMFADKAGLNIVFHPSALIDNTNVVNSANNNNNGGNAEEANNTDDKKKQTTVKVNLKATLDLVNVPLNDAFKMVLKVSGLTYFMEGNTIFILSQQEAKTSGIIKKELRTIPVKYVDAAGLARFLNNNIFAKNQTGLSNTKIAVTNTSTNEIIIMGTDNDYRLASQIVTQFDKKPLEETFLLNHTTPREMAYLLCEVLFKNLKLMQDEEDDDEEDDDESSDDSSSESSSEEDEDEQENIKLSETDDIKGNLDNIVLGRGLVACRYKNRIKTSKIQSLHTGGLTVTYYTTKGKVSIFGASSQQMEEARNFIKEKDKKQLQAIVEMSIIELTENGSKVLDNAWRFYSNAFSATFEMGKDKGLKSTSYPTFFKGDGYQLGVNGAGNPVMVNKYPLSAALSYTINYLIYNEKGRVLANPKIIVTNGQKSVIDLSRDYIQTVKTEIMSNNTSATPPTQKTVTLGHDQGIKVELYPFISNDGFVTLNIKPEYVIQLRQEKDSKTQDVLATLNQRRNLDLRGIRIRDGETIIIGGLIQENENKKTTKIPFLGDLPGIGAMFRSTSSDKDKSELVIMLTPKILSDDIDSKEVVKGGSVAL